MTSVLASDLDDSAKDISNPLRTAAHSFSCNENSNIGFSDKVTDEPHSNHQKPAGDHPHNSGVNQSGNFGPSQPSVSASNKSENSFDQTKRGSSFSLTPEQIKCPVIIEIFCGSGRVTASLKFLGITACFGVDHLLDKTFTSAKQLDLTLKVDQEKLFLWLRSPLVPTSSGDLYCTAVRNMFSCKEYSIKGRIRPQAARTKATAFIAFS